MIIKWIKRAAMTAFLLLVASATFLNFAYMDEAEMLAAHKEIILETQPEADDTGESSYYGENAVKEVLQTCVRYWDGKCEVFDPTLMTAASNNLPLNSCALVTRVGTGESIFVRINDTGGFAKYDRVLDLSMGAFAKLQDTSKGTIDVEIRLVENTDLCPHWPGRGIETRKM